MLLFCSAGMFSQFDHLIISTAFVRWKCGLSRKVNVCFKDIEEIWAEYGAEHSSQTSSSAAFSRRV